MGTKVHSESYLPGYHSMRDLNDDSNSCSWSNYYGDTGYDKDVLRRTMLEQEATFKSQVAELHRLYRVLRELMDERKKKDLQKNRIPIEPLLSSSLLASQNTSKDAHKWHIPSFSLGNSLCGRPSISGVEDSHSPLNSVKGSTGQASRFPSQNEGNSNNVEVLECRSTKVRRKMFDLQYPAEDYVDTEDAEQFRDNTTSGTSSYLPTGNGKIGPVNGGKLFHEGKTACLEGASRFDSCSRGKNSLADLNEPAQIEETNGSAYSHFLGHDSYHGGYELSAKPKQEFLGLPRDISVNFLFQSDNKSVINGHVQKNITTRGFFSHVLEAGHSESKSKSISQGFQPQKLPLSSQQVEVLYERTHDSPTFSITNQSKEDVLREIMCQNSEISENNRVISNNSNAKSIVMSDVPSLNPFASSDVIKPWSHLVSSWDKPFSSLSERSTTVPAHPFLNSSGPSGKSSMISSRSSGIFGEKWQVSSNSRLIPSVGSELPNQTGFSYGSSSGSKEPAIRFPSGSYDYPNCTNDRKGAREHFTSHGSTKPCNFLNSVDMKSPSGVNLNVVLSNSSSNESVLQRGPKIDGGRNHEDHLRGLSWLHSRPVCKNEVTVARRDLNVRELSFSQSFPKKSTDKYETGNDFSQNSTQDVKSVSFSNNVETNRSAIGECLNNKKILGIPIFERHYVSKNESSSTAPYASVPRPSDSEAENKGRIRFLDINLPCDATLPDLNQDIIAEKSVIEKEAENLSSFRHHFDLNSCVDEDEASFIPSVPSTVMKMIRGVDLEAPVVPELKDVIHGEELLEKACGSLLQSAQIKDDSMQDELVKIAAEAIVDISSYCQESKSDNVNCNSPENSTTDPLNWFVETISSFGEDLERKVEALAIGKDGDRKESTLEEIDDFESMILSLAETREEDYMPEPLVPENFKEETGATSLLATRTRKGQGRRGRRRDFQRDILPGLSSLSRLEVTEDLQIFGGIMRATGHSWQSGVTRRNSARTGCGRGRRRSVTSSPPALVAATTCMPLTQQLNNIEVGLEDRSLTGWGKTTRRPRRQRCPTGNPPSLVLT